MKPRYYHSGMTGAPAYVTGTGGFAAVLKAVLVNGFNVKAPTSAVAADGVLTLNYSAAPGYELLCWVRVEGADVPQANGDWQVTVVSGNQIAVEIDGLPDGPVGGSISTKVAPAGWVLGNYGLHEQGDGLAQGPSPDMPQRGFRFFQATVAPRLSGYEAVDIVAGTASGQFPTTSQQQYGDVRFLSATTGTNGWGNTTWFVVATDRWCYPACKGANVLGFAGDLAHRVDPTDAYAAAVVGIGSASSTKIAYLAGRGGVAVAQPGDFDLFANVSGRQAWPDVYNSLIPYIPVYETGAASNKVRGVLPNAYRTSSTISTGAAGVAGTVVSDVSGVPGRVVLLGADVGISIDEEAWPL